MSRFKSRFYSIQKIVFRDHEHRYAQDENGYLYAGAIYPTKIKAEDLPPWYIYGRYYKRFGFLCAKGVTDMVYRPSRWSNHFLKDDCLMVSYHGKVVIDESLLPSLDAYSEFDERVWDGEILTFLKGARDYSDYDISGIAAQIQEKADWLPSAFPREFSDFTFDVKEYLDMPLKEKKQS